MKEENMLPENFDGVFRFTNSRDTEFKAKWNSIEYTFPAMSTTPMIISGASPEDVQFIRKKFAKEWAIEQFYQSDKFKRLDATGKLGTPALYTDADLVPYIQKCLEPLPLGQIKAKAVVKNSDEQFSKDEDGNPRTKVLKGNESLTSEGSAIVG